MMQFAEEFPDLEIVGDYTYYDDVDGADQFEKHVTHFYGFIGDKLIIGKFCAIAIEEIESLMPILSCSDLEKVKAELKAWL